MQCVKVQKEEQYILFWVRLLHLCNILVTSQMVCRYNWNLIERGKTETEREGESQRNRSKQGQRRKDTWGISWNEDKQPAPIMKWSIIIFWINTASDSLKACKDQRWVLCIIHAFFIKRHMRIMRYHKKASLTSQSWHHKWKDIFLGRVKGKRGANLIGCCGCKGNTCGRCGGCRHSGWSSTVHHGYLEGKITQVVEPQPI